MPQEGAALLEQIKGLIAEYIALPYDDPLKPVFSGLMEQIEGLGETGASPAASLEAGGMPPEGGLPPEAGAIPEMGTAPDTGQGPAPDILDEEPATDYEGANVAALADMKSRAKGEVPQPRRRKRRG